MLVASGKIHVLVGHLGRFPAAKIFSTGPAYTKDERIIYMRAVMRIMNAMDSDKRGEINVRELE